MGEENLIKKRIIDDKIASKLFQDKGNYLENNIDVPYERCSLEDFMENIYYREQPDDCFYPFEDEQCKEYVDWREQWNEKGSGNVVYQPDQNYKYNPIFVALCYKGDKDDKPVLKGYPYVLTSGLERMYKALEVNSESVISSPITYVGRNRTANNSRYIYALAFDLDGVGMKQLADLLYQMMNDVIPTANIIVNSGNGLHLYYIFKKPIALFKNAKETLAKLKRELTIRLWNQYTSTIEKPQFQGIFQGFRVPGSKTKRGEIVQAYINRDCPLYSVEDLCRRVSDGTEKYGILESEWKILDSGKYTSDRSTLKKAKSKWPEWYERVIVRGEKANGTYKVHRGLYDWWLKRLKDPIEPVSVGHRYFCLLALSMFAIKCGIEYEELERDAYSLVPQLDKLTKGDDNHFTDEDAEDALKAYKEDYCTFPKNSIEYLTGLPMPKRKRNGRKQELHLKLARANRDVLQLEKGTKWDENNGRPKGSVVFAEDSPQYHKVQEWRKNNPKSSNKSLCGRETGLSRPTVHKWWDRL